MAVRRRHRTNMQDASPPPDAETLYQSALSYLARYSATRASLRRTLMRRIDRWMRMQPDPEAAEPADAAARAAVEPTIDRLVRAGVLNDATFAETRAKRLSRAGKSARSVARHLVGKGVDPGLARTAAATEPETELASALVLARRRRIGPYRPGEPPDAAGRAKEMAMLARAGFSRDIAERALGSSLEEAEQRIFELRR